MASKTVMEEVSVEQLINAHSLIVPEIQREYVWGNNDYGILDIFFSDIKEGLDNNNNSSGDLEEQTMLKRMLELADESKKDFVKDLISKAKSSKDLNIGFLYSYKPPYYRAYDRSEDVYLIDGQQRFTTLFLSLLYFSLKEGKFDDFKALFRFDVKLEKLAFDYRVRSLTHNFLIELIANCNSFDDLKDISKKTWFLSDFARDVTINAIVGVEKKSNRKEIVGTLRKLDEYFDNDENEYYEFIKKQVKFWHFKTEETSQGEELYITMNSRGQQLADNENLRAKLFENEEVRNKQIEWGKEWEEWQDFFWKNKEKNGNADLGFNQFLKWVSIIECFKNGIFKSTAEGEKRYKEIQKNNEISESITLPVIRQYFNALRKIKDKSDSGEFNLSWFKDSFDSDWLKKPIDQKHLIKLLPALIYLSHHKFEDGLKKYIRFFNNLIKDSVISRNPDTYIIQCILMTIDFCNSNLTDVVDVVRYKSRYPQFITTEEEYKLNLYRKASDNLVRESIEKIFWYAEDYLYCGGKIDFLIELSFYHGEAQNFSYNPKIDWANLSDFDVSKFTAIVNSYRELTQNVNELYGEFLHTDIYGEYGSRITEKSWSSWHRNVDFLKLVFDRTKRNSETLLDFVIQNEKSFVKRYNGDANGIKNESSSKNQLYLYYIIHKRILNNWYWNWNNKRNFGAYDLYEIDNSWNYKSLFNNRKIYQFYDKQWRYNMGYDTSSSIWLQNNFDNTRDYAQELINWAER